MSVEFAGLIRTWRPDGGLAVVDVPPEVAARLGGRRQRRVSGTLQGVAFTGSTMLVSGGGMCVGVSRAALRAAKAAVGDQVTFSLEPVDRS